MRTIRALSWLVVGAALSVAAAAQEGAPPPKAGAAQSAPPSGQAGAPKQPAGAQQTGGSPGAASAKSDSGAGAAGKDKRDVIENGEFIPSEELSPDEDVTFPVDI